MPEQADLPEHLKVVFGALFDALGFEQLVLRFEELDPLDHLPLYFIERLFPRVFADGIVRRGEDGGENKIPSDIAGKRVKFRNPFHLVAEKLDADAAVGAGRREDFDRIPLTRNLSRTKLRSLRS